MTKNKTKLIISDGFGLKRNLPWNKLIYFGGVIISEDPLRGAS